MNRSVFLTFDVECSMGGAWARPDRQPVPPARAVWGHYGDQQLGLPRIVEILQARGLAATFFVEAFTDEQGYPGEMERACHYLLDRGQDVQLHIHPNHFHFGLHRQGKPHPRTDSMARLGPAEQQALLAEGGRRLEQWTGRKPAAFRAGNMGASEETLEQLAAVGIPIDSSYTFPYLGGHCRFRSDSPYNGSKWYGGVLELALSGFRQAGLSGQRSDKLLDLKGVSFQECRSAIEQIVAAGADAVVILHSFSLFKVRNVQYEGGRPDRIVTRRLQRLCDWLAGPAGAPPPAATFSQVAEVVRSGAYRAADVPPCRLTHPRAVVRKAVQAWNHLYWT